MYRLCKLKVLIVLQHLSSKLSYPIKDAEALGARNNISSAKRVYFPAIDGLRFIAFILVFIHHGLPTAEYFKEHKTLGVVMARLQSFGWIGVDVFLVISSFLIFTLLLTERGITGSISIRDFYIRRALRIWPLYFTYLIIAFFILPFTLYSLTLIDVIPTYKNHLLTFFTFTANASYVLFTPTLFSSIAHLWTISLEEQFYIVAPLLVTFAPTFRRWVLWFAGGALVITIAFRIYVVVNEIAYPMVWVNTLCRLDPLVIGALCALLVHRRPDLLQRQLGSLYLLGGIMIFYITTSYPAIYASGHVVWQLGASAVIGGCLVLAVLTRGILAGLLGSGPFPFFGKISFGLYVYHEIALDLLRRTDVGRLLFGASPVSWLISMGITLSVCIAISSASYRYYERPFLTIKRRFEAVRSRPS